jgi:hypothetical protein
MQTFCSVKRPFKVELHLPRPQSLSKGGEENEKKFFVGRAKNNGKAKEREATGNSCIQDGVVSYSNMRLNRGMHICPTPF